MGFWRRSFRITRNRARQSVYPPGDMAAALFPCSICFSCFNSEGVDGLLHEATRPAGKAPLTSAVIERVVAMTLAEPPGETTHWTCGRSRKPPGSAIAASNGSGRRTV
jgi:hypothetical protein